jgi:hypothetical protein
MMRCRERSRPTLGNMRFSAFFRANVEEIGEYHEGLWECQPAIASHEDELERHYGV